MDITYSYKPAWSFTSSKKWIIRFTGGFLLWLVAIALGLIALKGQVDGIGNRQWWYQTGSVYLVWGFLNYLVFFGLLYFIIPFGIETRRYWAMIAYTYALIIAIGLIKYYFVSLDRFEYVRVSHYKNGDETLPVYFTFLQYIQKTLFTGTFVSLLAYGLGLTLNWRKGEKKRMELEAEKRNAELAFLRMQFDSHFLFNTLNSIYSLCLQKNDEAPKAVLQLSDMMRYMIYEDEDEHHKVALEKEIGYLQNYVRLQETRFKHHVHVEFVTEGHAEGKTIVPMLLMPFIENGFKHGDLGNSQQPLKIHLIIDDERLILRVKNRKNLDKKYYVGGIGLDNVKKRLNLLYPNRYQLNVEQTNESFQTELIIVF